MYRKVFKRLFDILLSLFLLILLSPLLVIITILLCFDFACKPFFVQKRLGYKNKSFNVLKFRKFREPCVEQNLGGEEECLTFLGRIIRQTSIDELPQLFNILLGQMSFIGPRPLLEYYKNYYTPRELKRHNVRPGLTGWAQVNGRRILDWDKRMEYDIYYVENLSFFLDIKIIMLTIKALFRSFKKTGENTIKSFPRFVHHRAYIRMPSKDDDLEKLKNLYSKGEKALLSKIFDKYKEDILNRKILDFIVLIDDYKGDYNSFVYASIDNNKILIEDYFIDHNKTFLTLETMKKKYNQLLVKYFRDLGYNNPVLSNVL